MTATQAKQFTHMPQRRLGRGELVVSALGLGCMGMSEFCGSTDETESVRVTVIPGDLARIDQELPSGMAAGDRYDPIGMNRLNP